ncbi:MAG: ParB/RepB/Spo0J family partition protein [Candidatus Hydrogenedentes bacterium]|nr:ParB/RepB/Spo0J family partition protein [Candidatus Hydrogenedentota bacterium]
MREFNRKPLSWFKRGSNVRKSERSEIELLAIGQSMKDEGQHEPVIAAPDGTLLIGYGRLKAAQMVGLESLEVIITDEVTDEGRRVLIQAQENMLRHDLTDFEKACIVERLRALFPKWSSRDLAQHLHVDPSTVTRLDAASKVVPEVRQALEAGNIGITHLYEMSKTSEPEQRRLLALALAGASRDAIEREGRKLRSGLSKDDRLRPVVRLNRLRVPMRGAIISIAGGELSLDDVIEVLSEVLKQARKSREENLDARTWQRVMSDRARA